MNDFLVAEFVNSIDSVLLQPIQLTQRIKYTSYDVSQQFIVFGANSGGLYIFKRHPCEFIKLIPSTEGSVVYLSISNDEKIVAVATCKGTLLLVNLNDVVPKDVPVYMEHQGNTVTAMKWLDSNNELFIGDNTGKISVIIVNFITKTMFQTPCTTLMQLDSRIVQLDISSHFLLVSTLSRCYLCDTDVEKYRQLGKKLREGEYGACFFGHRYTYTNERRFELRTFNILSDNESFTTGDGVENLKIFCARPGSRLWEVQLDGTVIRTHQFKQALSLGPSNVIQINSDLDCRLNTKSITKTSTAAGHSFNFVKLYILKSHFIVTYQKNGLYIFDPQNASVLFWTDVYKDIIDVKIVNKFLYLWTGKNQIHVLTFSNLEDFVIKCLFRKQYLLCADLCIAYQKNIKKILPLSKKLYLLSNLSEKLLEKNALELKEKLDPILVMIKQNTAERQTAQKLNSGIFVIDNAHFISNTIDETFVMNKQKVEQIEESTSKLIEPELPVIESELNKTFDAILEEYKIDRTKTLEQILHKLSSLSEIIDVFVKFEAYTNNDERIKNWCYEKCTFYIDNNRNSIKFDKTSTKYLLDAFTNVNTQLELACTCDYPLPKASLHKPKLYDIITTYIRELDQDSIQQLCHKVPYLWKHIIGLRQNDNLLSLLPLILQYSDIKILEEFNQRFTYDIWNEILQKFILLKSSKCLNCEHKFPEDKNTEITWNVLAKQMIKSIGGESTVYLLQQYADNIPTAELDIDFYQTTILTTIIDHFDTNLRANTADLVARVNQTNQGYLGVLLEKSLHNSESSNSKESAIQTNNLCISCQIPLLVPVLSREEFIKLNCGHIFHKICFKSQHSVCNICK